MCIENLKKFGFTLAEFLIAIAIVGIVAAVTIPSLVQKYNERIIITSLKKFQATFSQAVNLTVANEGNTFSSKALQQNLKVEKVCEQTAEGCTDKQRFTLGGWATQFGPSDYFKTGVDYVKLIDGSIIRMGRGFNAYCDLSNTGYCNEIAVDINGDKGPNILGRDTFYFYITVKGVVPFGFRGDKRTPFTGCVNKLDGYQCTAWVIENENMDYLHCDDLSWEGKHKCSE